MSKSLKALENLVHCKSETKCKECKHKYRCTMERDYITIKQDLERLEELNRVWHDNETMESVDIKGKYLQDLYDYNMSLFEENLALDKKALELEKENKYIRARYEELDNENRKLKDKIQVLEQSIKDTYDTSQEIIAELKEKKNY